MSVSIKQQFKTFNSQQEVELKRAFDALQTDLTNLRATVAALVTDMATRITNHNTLRTKLNADGGVTDTDYAAATAQTSAAPSALTLTD